MKKTMYSFKNYDHNGIFISEIPQNFIKNVPIFNETINSGQGECILEFSHNIDINFGNLIKIFCNGKNIYSGFVIRKEINFSLNSSGVSISLVGVYDNLRNFSIFKLPSYYSYHYLVGDRPNVDDNRVKGNAILFFKEIVNFLKNNESQFYNIDISQIIDLSENFQNKMSSGTFLDLLKYFKEKYNMNFFIGADGLLRSGSNVIHNLFFNKDISEITFNSDILGLANDIIFTRKFFTSVPDTYDRDGRVTRYKHIENSKEYKLSDEESIRKYGVKFKDFGAKSFAFSNEAEDYIQKLLNENKNPKENITLKIYEKKWFGVLQVMDLVNIKNIKKEVKNKRIVKISYSGDHMTVELESYNTLGNILLGE